MAQKKEQYEGAVDSIFNFIFSARRKSPPLKPGKPLEGVHGSEMAYALGEIAAAPSIYASEQALNVINEPLGNVTLAETKIKLDGQNQVKVGFNLANASEFFNDPDGFIDKAFTKTEGGKKAAKQLNMLRGFGGIMDLGIGAVAARSIGAPPIESLEMGSILGSESLSPDFRNNKAEELATRVSALEAARMKGLNYNEANKIAQTFTSVMESSRLDLVGKDITALERADKVRLKNLMTKKLSHHRISLDDSDFQTLLQQYADRAKKYGNNKGYDWNLGDLDKSLTEKRRRGPNNLDAWIGSKNAGDKLRALKFEELEAEISLLGDEDPEKYRLIRQRDQIKTWQLANSHKMRWSAYLGEASLNIQHFNGLVLQGGAIPALISGDFFDTRKNNMSPSVEKEISILGQKHKINVARNDQNRFYTRLNTLYYYTPGSIGKTLFVNGEGFLHRAHLKQEKIRDLIRGSDPLFRYITGNSDKFPPGFFGGIDMFNRQEILERLTLGENYMTLLSVLNSDLSSISDVKLLELLDGIENLHKKIENSLGLKYALGIQKIFAKFQKISPQKLLEKGVFLILGKKLGEKFKGYFIDGQIALKKLARSLAKKGVHALAQALGFATTGGLANALIYVATEVIYFIGEKLLKPVVKIMAFVAWGFGVVLFVMAFGVISFLDSLNPFSSIAGTFDTAGNAAPIFCEKCGGEPLFGILPGDEVDEEGNVIDEGGSAEPDPGGAPSPEYSDADCPLGTSAIDCSQAPYGGFSHGSRNAIDTIPPATAWYAPSDGVITRSIRSYENSRRPGQLCGGIVTFVSEEHGVTHQIVHVVPNVANGQQVKKGDLVATMAFERDGNINFSNAKGTCTTGAHFHIELLSGTSVYADRYYVEFLNCNINACPGRPQFEPKEIEASGEFKTFSGSEFVALGDSVIGVSSSSTKPHITGNSEADKIIQGIAENRGYKLRGDAGSSNASSEYNSMASAASSEEGLNLHLGSHYRSVSVQRDIFMNQLSSNCTQNNYANIINGNCNTEINNILKTYSIPGYSKHHTGYAIDLKCGANGKYQDFKNSACFSWLSANNYYNAKRFGFIPSYPAGGGNQGPDPEEWEYVLVGTDKLK